MKLVAMRCSRTGALRLPSFMYAFAIGIIDLIRQAARSGSSGKARRSSMLASNTADNEPNALINLCANSLVSLR